MGEKIPKKIIKVNDYQNSLWTRFECAMTFRMIVQLWNTNTPVIISRDADLTENYMYISMKFRTGVNVFCWEVGVFNRSCFQSVSCKNLPPGGKFAMIGCRLMRERILTLASLAESSSSIFSPCTLCIIFTSKLL